MAVSFRLEPVFELIDELSGIRIQSGQGLTGEEAEVGLWAVEQRPENRSDFLAVGCAPVHTADKVAEAGDRPVLRGTGPGRRTFRPR